MCGLTIDIFSFAHLLKKVDFDSVVYHLALIQIIESKVEPAANRIKRLIETLSSYSLNLYYIKGKDVILSDFLLRQKDDVNDQNEIMPKSVYMQEVLHA